MVRYYGLRGKTLNTFMLVGVIGPAYILFGYNNACAGGLLGLPAWIQTFPQIDTLNTTGAQQESNSRVQGTVVAMYTLGCFFGALSCIFLGDRLGRIRTMMLGAFVHIIGATLQASSFSLPQLIIGRLVSGLGLGALSATAPNWQSECSKAEHRGSTVLLEGLYISSGLAIVSWINFGMSHTSGSVAWRFPLALAALWSIIVLLVVPGLPESPRWLIKKGRIDEAREVLAALDDLAPDSEEVTDSVKEIESSLLVTGQGRFRDIFQNGPERLFHRACLAAAGQLFQQMSGINAIAFYIATIFEQYLGLTAVDARILGAAVFTWQTACSPLGVLTVDKFGRRKLMIFSTIGMGCCMTILAGTVSFPQNHAAIAVAGIFIFMFSFFFPTGFLGLTFLYATEVAPLSVRVPITSISTGTAWLFNFVVAEVTPIGFTDIRARYYIVFACMNFFLILPSVYFLFPETNGRTLEEVDEIFLQSNSIFDSVKVANNLPRQHLSKHGVAIKALNEKAGADLASANPEKAEVQTVDA
ncbi:hypothetical protein BZG36_01976 [Bifiguratus adelaidae]|uniref:Major facilitator superfamily (MFS) profile domain-containing protein n=1 Tax=Bifiguratus adelaidae TaxID=1938954 RepID=A0A261Y4I8_9FUNG|nr:hypothetical protein BZG36_01976 [Bifiguratus adelaidae]